MKTCKYERCSYDCFGGGYCRNHQWCRQDKNKPVVSTSINERKVKYIKPKAKVPTGELAMFKEIWLELPHVSELSGEKIYYFDIGCFHHILHKKPFPRFLLFKQNIILLTRKEHHEVETMAMSDLIKRDARWQLVADKHQQLKELYNVRQQT